MNIIWDKSVLFLDIRNYLYINYTAVSNKDLGFMTIFSFTAELGSEEACRLRFKEERDR